MKKKRDLTFGVFLVVFILVSIMFFVFVNFFSNKIFETGLVSASSNSQADINFEIVKSKGIRVYADTFEGSTTNFLLGGNKILESIEYMTLEKVNYGKIIFEDTINLTQDAYSPTGDLYNRFVNLDEYVEITDRRIEIDTNVLKSLKDKSAELSFYNLDFKTPKILKNGGDCPENVCSIKSYSEGILKVDVSNFSSYSVIEEEESEIIIVGGDTTKKSFSVSKDNLKIVLNQGKLKKEEIVIKNTGNSVLKMSLQNKGIENFMKVSEETFDLGVGETKRVVLTFFADENVSSDLYVGKLIIRGNNLEKKVLITLEIEPIEQLFDVEIKIPEQFKYILPGEFITAKINLFNFGAERLDAQIDYFIIDSEGKKIISEIETIAVETRASVIRIFQIPEDIDYGEYIIYAKVKYNGKVAIASEQFTVIKKSFITFEHMLLIISVIVMCFILFILYELKKLKRRTKITENILIREKLIKP